MRFIKYPKQKYDVFLALDGMEVHGELNQAGPLDLRQAITNLAESFLPITQATIALDANPAFIIKREAVLVNVQRIRFHRRDLETQDAGGGKAELMPIPVIIDAIRTPIGALGGALAAVRPDDLAALVIRSHPRTQPARPGAGGRSLPGLRQPGRGG